MYSELHSLTAHNSFVLVLAETGIVGFVLWVAFVGYCFRMMLVAVRQPPQALLGGAGGDDPIESDEEEEPDPAAIDAWFEDRDMALTLLLSLCGFFTAAFFLSRSYVVVLYLLAALVVAHYTGMRGRNPELPVFELPQDAARWAFWSAAGIVGLYVLVKVLMVLSL
jgi:O-antigen ligase